MSGWCSGMGLEFVDAEQEHSSKADRSKPLGIACRENFPQQAESAGVGQLPSGGMKRNACGGSFNVFDCKRICHEGFCACSVAVPTVRPFHVVDTGKSCRMTSVCVMAHRVKPDGVNQRFRVGSFSIPRRPSHQSEHDQVRRDAAGCC